MLARRQRDMLQAIWHRDVVALQSHARPTIRARPELQITPRPITNCARARGPAAIHVPI